MIVAQKESATVSSINDHQPTHLLTKLSKPDCEHVLLSGSLSNLTLDESASQSLHDECEHLTRHNTNSSNEIRHIVLEEALGLDFHSFLPGNNLSQVHFISNVQLSSVAYKAGLRDGDRILTINGSDVANVSHEDVRCMMLSKAAVDLAVINEPKYLRLIKIVENNQAKYNSSSANNNSSEQKKAQTSSNHFIKLLFFDDQGPVNVKHSFMKKETIHNTLGFLLRYVNNRHLVDGIEINLPAYNSGLCNDDVILFINGTSIEQMTHNDVISLIQTLINRNQTIDFISIHRKDIERYTVYQETHSIDWSSILSNSNGKQIGPQDSSDQHDQLATIYETPIPADSRICVLEKSNGFTAGFKISHIDSPPYTICKIEKDSPAEKAGLQLNDELLSINNKSVLHMNYKETIQTLQEALEQQVVEFVVRQKSLSRKPDKNDCKSRSWISGISEIYHIRHSDIDEGSQDAVNIVQEYQKRRNKELSYTLRLCHLNATRADGASTTTTFGFEITDDHDYDYPIVSSIEPKLPGERAGLQPRDILLKVNNHKTKRLHFEKVKKLIDKAKNDGRLEILVVDQEVFDYCKNRKKKFKEPDIKVKHIFPKTRSSASFLKLHSIIGSSPMLSQDNTPHSDSNVSSFNVHRLSIPKEVLNESEYPDSTSHDLQSANNSDGQLRNKRSATVQTCSSDEMQFTSIDHILNSFQQINSSSTDPAKSNGKQRKISQSSTDQSFMDFISNTMSSFLHNIGLQKSSKPDHERPIEQVIHTSKPTELLPFLYNEKTLSEQVRQICESRNTVCSNNSNGSYDYIRDPRRCILQVDSNKGLGFIISATNDYDHTITAVEKNSAADIAGLQVNDEVIEINGIYVHNVKYDKVVDMLISAMKKDDKIEICVVNGRSNDARPASNGIIKEKKASELVNSNNHNNNNNNDSLPAIPRTIPVVGNEPTSTNQSLRSLDGLNQQIQNKSFPHLHFQPKCSNPFIDRTAYGSLPTLSTGITTSPKDLHQFQSYSSSSKRFRDGNILNICRKEAPIARLCSLRKVPSSSFYGLFLSGNREKLGHVYVSSIMKNSSAALCGLRDGDHILEVNGTNIQTLTYDTILDKIKHHMEHHDLNLLVLDKKSVRWYRQRNYPMTLQTIPTVVHIEPIINSVRAELESDRTTAAIDSIDQPMSTTKL